MLLLPLIALAGTACTKPPEAPSRVRSVRTLVAAASKTESEHVYAGEVRPRYESNLGFRVSGKIQRRLVNVGDKVKTGDLLLQLDVQDLALSEAASQATVQAQQARFAVEKADFERYGKLAATGYISKTEYDRQKTHFQAAKAELESVKAQARVSGNQTTYAALRADTDGTITAVEAETGQVVAAGQTVVIVAKAGEMEVAAAVPEQGVRQLKAGMAMEVSLWTKGSQRFPASLRELALSADSATRTYPIRVHVSNPPTDMKLGMSASVIVPSGDLAPVFRIPLTAIVQRQGAAGIWVFDAATGTVKFKAVQIVGVADNDALIGEGIASGERIVTAGAMLLHEGQQVKLMATDQPAG